MVIWLRFTETLLLASWRSSVIANAEKADSYFSSQFSAPIRTATQNLKHKNQNIITDTYHPHGIFKST